MKKIITTILILSSLLQTTAYCADLSSYAVADFTSAGKAGLISYDTVLQNIQQDITREEFCSLAINLYKSLSDEPLPTPEFFPFDDSNSYPVAQAFSLGIISGTSDTEFSSDKPMTKEEISKVIASVLLKCGIEISLTKSDENLLYSFTDGNTVNSWAINPIIALLKFGILTGSDENTLSPSAYVTREQAIILINRAYNKFSQNAFSISPTITYPKNGASVTSDTTFKWDGADNADKYKLIIKDNSGTAKIIYTTKNTYATIPYSKLSKFNTFTAIIQAELDGRTYLSLPLDFTTAVPTPTKAPAPASTAKQAVTEKELRVFESGYYFTSKAEAQQSMTDITVDVWKISSSGEKVASTLNLTVNKNLAEDIKLIFKEIFDDESKFPIKSAGCFQWRNTSGGRLSQHSYGTCIDINPNENYYVSPSGTALSGSYWKPNEDPYSVTEDGIVVKTFAKYGFLWGGNAWGEKSNKDYMHFTYLGN